MTRVLPALVFVVLAAVLWPTLADDPPQKLTPEQRKELEAKWKDLTDVGSKAYQEKKYPEAAKAFEGALGMARRLYPKDEFPDGHANLAASLHNLALFREELEMHKRLSGDDHPDVAVGLNNLAALLQSQGKLAEAEALHRQALELKKRLYKGDHASVALSLHNLAFVLHAQRKYDESE